MKREYHTWFSPHLGRDMELLRGLFDGHYCQKVYENTPSHYIPRLANERKLSRLRRMEITLVIGEEDAFLENNRQMSHALTEKGIGHRLHIWSGEAHKARYWRPMVSQYL